MTFGKTKVPCWIFTSNV